MDNAVAGKLGGGTDAKVGAILALGIDAGNIHRTAVALEPQNAGLAGKFPIADHSDASIIATADAYLLELEILPGDSPAVQAAKTALANLFIAQDLPATFVADLRADRDGLNPVVDAQEGKRQDKVEDTAELEVLIKQGVALVNLCDAGVHNKLGRNADAMRGWKSASHLERAPKRAKPTTPAKPANP